MITIQFISNKYPFYPETQCVRILEIFKQAIRNINDHLRTVLIFDIVLNPFSYCCKFQLTSPQIYYVSLSYWRYNMNPDQAHIIDQSNDVSCDALPTKLPLSPISLYLKEKFSLQLVCCQDKNSISNFATTFLNRHSLTRQDSQIFSYLSSILNGFLRRNPSFFEKCPCGCKDATHYSFTFFSNIGPLVWSM